MKNSSGYFVVSRILTPTTARISDPEKLPRRASNWISGETLPVPVPNPILFKIEEGDEGDLAAYHDACVPLMSIELVEVLQSNGVTNLDLHNAVIREVASGKEFHTHRAVNIVGRVSIADKSKSQASSIEGMGQWVHKMVPDASLAGGALLFRMEEGLSQIIVHQKIKDAIEARKLPLIQFYPLEEFSG